MKYKLGEVCSRLSSGKGISAKFINEQVRFLYMVEMDYVGIVKKVILKENVQLLVGRVLFAEM